VVYPPPNNGHKGLALRFFAENVKIYFQGVNLVS